MLLSNRTPSTLAYTGLRLSTVILVKLLQPKNALPTIDVTEEGMVILVKFSHNENALPPIVVNEDGMVTLVKLSQA